MKKALIVLITFLMILGGTSTAMAVIDAPAAPGLNPAVIEMADRAPGQHLAKFQDELHQVADLRIAWHNLSIQILEKKSTILTLTVEAQQNQNMEALKAAREIKQELNPINEAIRSLHEQLRTEHEAFWQSLKTGDFDEAEVHIQNWISLGESINANVESKLPIFDSIIDILS